MADKEPPFLSFVPSGGQAFGFLPSLPPGDDGRKKMQRPTETEAKTYYYGLPSRPMLVARTSTGPLMTIRQGYPEAKQLFNIGHHEPLTKVWESDIIPELLAILQDFRINWTAIDMIRIGPENNESQAKPILWIGVVPGSTSHDSGLQLAKACKILLMASSIEDVECEVRETNVLASVMPPKLIQPTSAGRLIREISLPISTTIGQAIAPKAKPFAEGTLGFYIQMGGDRTHLFAVTCAHVLFPEEGPADLYRRRNVSEPAYNVIVLPDETHSKMMEAIGAKVDSLEMSIEITKLRFESKTIETEVSFHADAKQELEGFKTSLNTLNEFKDFVTRRWADPKDRVIGSAFLSPPVGTMDEEFASDSLPFTRDWAVFQVDKTRFDKDTFQGNLIDLTWEKDPYYLRKVMAGNAKTYSGFKYPNDGLMRVYGTIQTEEMAKPTTLAEDGEAAIMVMKRGRTTGLTVGRANELYSFVRKAWKNLPKRVHREWCVIGDPGPFSKHGDSGAAVVDAKGRLGGLLTGGVGTSDRFDITYATPIGPLLKDIERHGFGKVNVNPVL